MRRCFTLLSLSQLVLGPLVLLTMACSSGSAPSGSGATPGNPPQSLAYATNPAVYTLGQAISANGPSHLGGAVTGYSISPALPAGLALDATTGILSGTPTVLAALATYSVTASNADGSTTVALAITVKDIPPTNLVYGSPSASYTVGTAITPNLATHGGGAVVAFSVSPALPIGLLFNTATGAVTGTPSVSAANATYTVTATNSGGSTTANLSLAVIDLSPTGLTYAFPTSTYTVGTAIAANTPSHGGGVVTLYSVSPSLPAGIDLNASTGVLSGLPSSPATLAVYTITATNSGGSSSCGLSITVNPAVTGKTWYSATTLSLDNPGDAMDPQLAFGGSGLATAVWEQSYGAGLGVWARRFTPGTGWAPAVRLEANATESAVAPRVAMDAAGNALVVWLQRINSTYSIWANHFTAGVGWDGAVQLDSGGVGNMADLRVAMDAAGHGVTAWIILGTTVVSPVHAAQYQTGSGWSTAIEVIADAGWIDLAINPSGSGMLVASAADVAGTTDFSMWGIPFSTATGWGAAAHLENDSTGGWDVVPCVAVDPSGGVVAVWQRYDSVTGIWNPRSNHFTPSGGWGAAELIMVNTLGSSSAGPRIALDANGNGIAVWSQTVASGKIQIWSNRLTQGSGWGTASLLENFRAGDNYPAQYPEVAFDPAGDAFALWLDSGGDIQGVGYTLGTGWGTQRAMGPGTTQAPGAPQIAFDGNGNAFAIWYQVIEPSNLLQYSIWVSRYE